MHAWKIQWLIGCKSWFEVTILTDNRGVLGITSRKLTNPDWHEQWKKNLVEWLIYFSFLRMFFFYYPVWFDRDFVMKSFSLLSGNPERKTPSKSRRFPGHQLVHLVKLYLTPPGTPNGFLVRKKSPKISEKGRLVKYYSIWLEYIGIV